MAGLERAFESRPRAIDRLDLRMDAFGNCEGFTAKNTRHCVYSVSLKFVPKE